MKTNSSLRKRNVLFAASVAAGLFTTGALIAAPAEKPAALPAVTAQIFSDSFCYRGHSPELNLQKGEEGIAWDGTNHYLIYRYHILKVDSTWTNVLARNDKPFTGLTGFDHLGAGEYYDGKLYIATEAYHGCGNVTNQSISIFDANTLDRISTTSVSNFTTEVSAVTMVTNMGPHGIAFVSNFCDDAKIYKFDISNLEYLGTVPFDMSVPKLQGIAYHDGLIYAVTDDGTNGIVYNINPDNGHTRKLAYLTFPYGKEVEGCLFNGDRLEVLVSSHARHHNYIYYFSPR